MAVLEIPELEAQLDQDRAIIKAQSDQVTQANNEIARVKAQENVYKLQYDRLAGVQKRSRAWSRSRRWTMRRASIWRRSRRRR